MCLDDLKGKKFIFYCLFLVCVKICFIVVIDNY